MSEPIPQNPIVNGGLLYANGLQIANTGTSLKKLFLNQGAARDSKNINDIVLSLPVTMNGALVGPNGVDVAPFVANSIYAVYVIGDSTNNHPTAGLFSLFPAFPVLPTGYDMYRRVGWILTDGVANIVNFVQLGVNENRSYYYQVPKNVLITGSSNLYALVDLSAVVPPITQTSITATNEVFLNVLYAQASSGNIAQFHYNTFSSPPPGIVILGYGAIVTADASLIVPSQNQKIAYRVGTGDTLTINVTGYTDYLF